MQTFKGLTGKEALLEFALELLHTMPAHDEEKIDALFEEAKQGKLFEEKEFAELYKEAKEILPIAELFYDSGKDAEMKKFSDFRDKVLALSGAN